MSCRVFRGGGAEEKPGEEKGSFPAKNTKSNYSPGPAAGGEKEKEALGL